ncbi:transcription repressor OFP13-like [Triticum dicoccoides]|uniref:transcription repressor OFP13-like n=1 Tax=Triticum dicoccoides TaxID=85692 RepID=UPI000E7918C1|nr:transcription repressor OFP13-like [Triticum dicoccoides]
MVKKLGLTSLIFSSKQVDSAASTSGAAPSSVASSSMSATSWQWPSCKQPRTLSFRQQQHHQTAYKTMNSAYLPDSGADSCFSNSFASVGDSLSTASEAASGLVEANERETVIRALRSGRLFFEPHATPATSSSILDEANLKVKDSDTTTVTTCCGSGKVDKTAPFEGATALTMDSSNPYRDFRASMEEMVMSHGVKDWCWLEKMLGWYLRANGKSTHGLIVGAFVDLLVALSDTASPSSPTTASTNRSSSFSGTDEIKEEEG